MIDKLTKKLSRKAAKRLAVKTIAFKTGDISSEDFYVYLFKKAEFASVDFSKLPNLVKYAEYVKNYEHIDKASLNKDVRKIEEALMKTFAKTPDQERLIELSKKLSILKDLFALSLVRDKYEYYKANRDGFGVKCFTAFFDAKAPQYGLKLTTPSGIAKLDSYREHMEGFYDYAFKRDDAFLKNIGAKFGDKKIAVLVTGGFHTENLAELFEKEGYSYIEVMPRLQVEEDSPYFALLAGEKSPFEELITKAVSYTPGASTIAVQSLFSEMGIDVRNKNMMELMVKAAEALAKNETLTIKTKFGWIDIHSADYDTTYIAPRHSDTGFAMDVGLLIGVDIYVETDKDIRRMADFIDIVLVDGDTMTYLQHEVWIDALGKEAGMHKFGEQGEDLEELKAALRSLRLEESQIDFIMKQDIQIWNKSIPVSGHASYETIYLNPDLLQDYTQLAEVLIHETGAAYSIKHSESMDMDAMEIINLAMEGDRIEKGGDRDFAYGVDLFEQLTGLAKVDGFADVSSEDFTDNVIELAKTIRNIKKNMDGMDFIEENEKLLRIEKMIKDWRNAAPGVELFKEKWGDDLFVVVSRARPKPQEGLRDDMLIKLEEIREGDRILRGGTQNHYYQAKKSNVTSNKFAYGRGVEGLDNKEYKRWIEKPLKDGLTTSYQFDDGEIVQSYVKTDGKTGETFKQNETPGLVPAQMRLLVEVIGGLPNRTSLLKDVQIIIVPGLRSGHYGVSRAQIYLPQELFDAGNLEEISRQLYHEVKERSDVIEGLDEFAQLDLVAEEQARADGEEFTRDKKVTEAIAVLAAESHQGLLHREAVGIYGSDFLDLEGGEGKKLFDEIVKMSSLDLVARDVADMLRRNSMERASNIDVLNNQNLTDLTKYTMHQNDGVIYINPRYLNAPEEVVSIRAKANELIRAFEEMQLSAWYGNMFFNGKTVRVAFRLIEGLRYMQDDMGKLLNHNREQMTKRMEKELLKKIGINETLDAKTVVNKIIEFVLADISSGQNIAIPFAEKELRPSDTAGIMDGIYFEAGKLYISPQLIKNTEDKDVPKLIQDIVLMYAQTISLNKILYDGNLPDHKFKNLDDTILARLLAQSPFGKRGDVNLAEGIYGDAAIARDWGAPARKAEDAVVSFLEKYNIRESTRQDKILKLAKKILSPQGEKLVEESTARAEISGLSDKENAFALILTQRFKDAVILAEEIYSLNAARIFPDNYKEVFKAESDIVGFLEMNDITDIERQNMVLARAKEIIASEGDGPQMFKVIPDADETIESIASRMVEDLLPGDMSSVVFNGVRLVATSDDTADGIIRRYHNIRKQFLDELEAVDVVEFNVTDDSVTIDGSKPYEGNKDEVKEAMTKGVEASAMDVAEVMSKDLPPCYGIIAGGKPEGVTQVEFASRLTALKSSGNNFIAEHDLGKEGNIRLRNTMGTNEAEKIIREAIDAFKGEDDSRTRIDLQIARSVLEELEKLEALKDLTREKSVEDFLNENTMLTIWKDKENAEDPAAVMPYGSLMGVSFANLNLGHVANLAKENRATPKDQEDAVRLKARALARATNNANSIEDFEKELVEAFNSKGIGDFVKIVFNLALPAITKVDMGMIKEIFAATSEVWRSV